MKRRRYPPRHMQKSIYWMAQNNQLERWTSTLPLLNDNCSTSTSNSTALVFNSIKKITTERLHNLRIETESVRIIENGRSHLIRALLRHLVSRQVVPESVCCLVSLAVGSSGERQGRETPFPSPRRKCRVWLRHANEAQDYGDTSAFEDNCRRVKRLTSLQLFRNRELIEMFKTTLEQFM